jgi:hypothetical protein
LKLIFFLKKNGTRSKTAGTTHLIHIFLFWLGKQKLKKGKDMLRLKSKSVPQTHQGLGSPASKVMLFSLPHDPVPYYHVPSFKRWLKKKKDVKAAVSMS